MANSLPVSVAGFPSGVTENQWLSLACRDFGIFQCAADDFMVRAFRADGVGCIGVTGQ